MGQKKRNRTKEYLKQKFAMASVNEMKRLTEERRYMERLKDALVSK
jgi:hypothetical protein